MMRKNETRLPFRVLAGVLAAFLLLLGLPLALGQSDTEGWPAWVAAGCCLYAGVGLAFGAWTGRWYGNPG